MKLDKDKLPNHVAIIMDGNRRWAKQRGLSILKGHRRAAYEAIEPLADVCIENKINYLTLWAFSTENWKRDKREIEGLLSLFRQTLSESVEKLHNKGVKVQTIGDLSKFPEDIQKSVAEGETKTRSNKKLTLTIALNYGGRDEILRAVNALRLKPEFQNPNVKITEEDMDNHLDTASFPDPDLIIRTGGEKRLSGFLPWQAVYSELYFTDVLFPDFTPKEFRKALNDYCRRTRRFGK